MTYNDLLKKLNAYNIAISTVSFDAETIAPSKGSPARNEALSILAGEYFQLLISPEAYEAIQLAKDDEDQLVSQGAQELLKEINKVKDIPVDEFIAFEALKNEAGDAWVTARTEKDYSIFKPYLTDLIESNKKIMAYRNKELTGYDACLDEYEEGLRMEAVDRFFEAINSSLVPFVDQVIQAQKEKPEFMHAFVSLEDQDRISNLLMQHLCFSDDIGTMGVSAHPFSTSMSINDVRITTHYHENDFTQSIFSIIHEIGHAMYSHQVNPEYDGTPLADNMSMSMHESQSRMLENMIGRSKAFWTPLYPKLQAIIPDVLGNVSLDTFIQGINYVSYNPIRIEADEITYPLHIMIRYEIERLIFEENHSTDDLDTIFAKQMERLVHIYPESDAQGILQDVHWSDASFGYFPTYALGSAYAAQFMKKMEADIPVEELLLEGNLREIFNWLKENIHQYSGTITAQDMILKVCNEPFDPKYYIDYLIAKYSNLVGINFEC